MKGDWREASHKYINISLFNHVLSSVRYPKDAAEPVEALHRGTEIAGGLCRRKDESTCNL